MFGMNYFEWIILQFGQDGRAENPQGKMDVEIHDRHRSRCDKTGK
jgi:hypothetical protein